LCPHDSGKWQKKINGRLRYFGCWKKKVDGVWVTVPDGWKTAQAEYEDFINGGAPTSNSDALRVKDLCNHFLTSKKAKVEAEELAIRSFAELMTTTDRLVAKWGHRLVETLTPTDWMGLRAELAKKYGPTRLGNEITRVKGVFTHGKKNGLCGDMVYGTAFDKPSKSVLRKHRANGGLRMMTPDQIRQLLNTADPKLKTMILLGLNAGLGNNDCASLSIGALDLDGGFLDYPRPKTGISRRARLWPETVQALRQIIGTRTDGPVFLTDSGKTFIRVFETSRGDDISRHFKELLRSTGLYRSGLSFYTLRSIYRTVADESLDQPAVDLTMGHSDNSMAGRYRQKISDERLAKVADHVRKWLFQ
jgi:integrase